MIIVNLILFFVICLLVFYLPGRFVLRKVAFKTESFVITAAVSLGFGVGLFLFGTYVLAFVNLSYLYYLFVLPLIFFEWRSSFFELKRELTLRKFLTLEACIIFIGTISMTYLTWRSGSIENGKLIFFGIHAVDSIYHQSLIGNLMHTFPPTHPGIAGLPLRGYNFFYDFLTVQLAKMYVFDRFDLFFRFVPLFTAFFYGLSGLALSRFFSLHKIATVTSLYLLYFAQNFSFFFRLLPNNFAANFNFEIIQSLGNIHDPSVVFSTTLLFLTIVTLFRLKSVKQWIIPAVLLGTIPTMKIHTGVIAFAPLFLIALYAFLKNRDYRYIGVLGMSGVIGAITYLPLNFGAGHLIFSPFHLYRHYMDSAPMFRNANWSVQYQIFQQHSNYPRMGFLSVVAMIAYLVPNLGIRLISLLLLPKMIKKSYWTYPKIYFFLSIVVAFLVPTLFIQSVYAFVIIQFLWVASILLVFPTSVVLASFVKTKSHLILGVYIFFLLFLTLPGTIVEFMHHSKNPYEVNTGIYQVSLAIPQLVDKDESIFVVNRKNSEGLYYVPLISSLTGRSVYFEPEVLEFSGTASEIERRVTFVDEVSKEIGNCSNPEILSLYLSDIRVKTGSTTLMTLWDEPCLENLEGLELLKKYDDTALYKIK